MDYAHLKKSGIIAAAIVAAVVAAFCMLALAWNPPPLPPELADSTRDYWHALPVFPGAEGFGTDTVAGRGGAILIVTTLAEEGPGSLRAALDTPGPRTILFEVGGVIELKNCLDIREPFVTVAGQTAPVPGVTITGAGMNILTHDVLVRHLRFRVGDRKDGPEPGGRDGLSVYGGIGGSPPAERVVVDHCSISWAIDENCSTWGAAVRDITFSNCIIAEGLSRSLHPEVEHSKGMLIGDHAKRFSVLRCLFANNTERNPLIKGDTSALVANNLIYNPGGLAIHFSDPEGSGPSCAAILNNEFIPGASTPAWVPMVTLLWDVKPASRAYCSGNLSPRHIPFAYLRPVRWLHAMFKSETQFPVQLKPLTLLPAKEVKESVLAQAGAWPAHRDATDARIAGEVRNGTGRVINSPAEVGGMPLSSTTRTTVTLPANPNNDDDKDGYTNLEEWLHECAKRAQEK